MNKPLLTIGILLSFGTVGCAGLGTQHASTLGAQLGEERGLGSLWTSGEAPAQQALEPTGYAGRALGLWDRDERGPTPEADRGYYQSRSGGDLWNPASVSRSWDRTPSSTPGTAGGGFVLSEERSGSRRARQAVY